jgi:hypothetical protein
MAKPKGHKAENGYSVFTEFDGGLGYKDIAEKMTESGHKMNLSTARNVLVSALDKVARGVCEVYGVPATEERLKKIAADPRFQSGVYDILSTRSKSTPK